MTQAVFRIPRGTSQPFDALQNEMNSYADKGFPLGVALSDAYQPPSLAPSGVLWGTTNTSSFAANLATQSDISAPPTVTITRDLLIAVPFVHHVGYGIGGMGLRVVTGVASSKAMFGIYSSIDDGRGNFYPARKLWGSTEITPTANNTSHQQTPNLVLAPGHVYWMAYTCGNAAGPQLVALPLDATSGLLGYSTGSGAPTNQTYLSGSRTYDSTLPSIYPAGQTAVATTAPLLWGYYDPSLSMTFTRSFPVWSPSVEGYAVRGVRLLSGKTTVRSGSSRPSVKITARIVNSSGSQSLGVFDSTNDVLKPGVPFYLTDLKTDATVLSKDAVLEAYVEQTGWPLLSVADCAVCCDVVRTRP